MSWILLYVWDLRNLLLIVWDFSYAFAKNQKNIYIGPGRGSAAGSLVSYCLGITHADPIDITCFLNAF